MGDSDLFKSDGSWTSDALFVACSKAPQCEWGGDCVGDHNFTPVGSEETVEGKMREEPPEIVELPATPEFIELCPTPEIVVLPDSPEIIVIPDSSDDEVAGRIVPDYGDIVSNSDF